MPLRMRPPAVLTADELERFWAQVDQQPGGCWPWTGNTGRDGYGRCWAEGSDRLAYRVAYELLVGPVPGGLTLDHVCHTADKGCPGGPQCSHRACCNPAHLEPVTFAENVARRRKTHCKRGHELTAENLRPGLRQCRVCHREDGRAQRARQRAARTAQGARP